MKKNGNGAANPAKEPTNDGSLPLFFAKPAALALERHGKAGIVPTQNFAFAAGTNSIPLNISEFVEAARYFPIVFTQGEQPIPVAIVGLEEANYFVNNSDNSWQKDAYIPAYVRKYPFVFMEVPEHDQLVLCVDESSPQYREKTGDGVLPFYEGKEPAALSKSALDFCAAYHRDFMATREFCKELASLDLLVANRSDAKLFNGRMIHLSGFQVIDEQKLNTLPDETFMQLRKKGMLPLLYCALLSSANWNRLVDLAAAREPEQAAA